MKAKRKCQEREPSLSSIFDVDSLSVHRYLYENCAFEECERTCLVNRDAASTLVSKEDKVNLECSIMSHQAQIAEKLGNSQKAIEISQQYIDNRLAESPRKLVLLAYSACNQGIIYSSANDFAKSLECFQQSRQWWEAHFVSKGESREYAASILVSEARCMIGLGEFDKAEEMLDTTIAKVKEEKSLNFGTLAYAYFCMGTLDRRRCRYESAEAYFMEAQNAWLRGEQTRLHPFNAGILYNIGACCLYQGKVEASIKHIRDSLEVTEFYSRLMPVENGRNYFKLSEALLQNGDDSATEAADLRDKAEFFLRKKSDTIDTGIDSVYDDLIPVYWR